TNHAYSPLFSLLPYTTLFRSPHAAQVSTHAVQASADGPDRASSALLHHHVLERRRPRVVRLLHVVVTLGHPVAIQRVAEDAALARPVGLPLRIGVGAAGLDRLIHIAPGGAPLLVEREADEVLRGVDEILIRLPRGLEAVD